ncbi:hypothetical protein [Janthinobacterium sp. PSPC3-1]|uniref:hypothetical protein n=1 Tax=Janthinobacterium sp. PSPC3-1 TaxID=2804653 RepID=UPI003CF726D4
MIRRTGAPSPAVLGLTGAYHNLLRIWGVNRPGMKKADAAPGQHPLFSRAG